MTRPPTEAASNEGYQIYFAASSHLDREVIHHTAAFFLELRIHVMPSLESAII